MLIKTLLELNWKVIEVILYLSGLGFIVWALFLLSTPAGLIGLGTVLLITGGVIDFLPKLKKEDD